MNHAAHGDGRHCGSLSSHQGGTIRDVIQSTTPCNRSCTSPVAVIIASGPATGDDIESEITRPYTASQFTNTGLAS